MKLDERLKQLREESGLSQKEFAQKHDIEVSKYNKWENGKYSPGYDELCRLANIFGCTTDYLLGMSAFRNTDEKEYLVNEMSEWFRRIAEFSPQLQDQLLKLLRALGLSKHVKNKKFKATYLDWIEAVSKYSGILAYGAITAEDTTGFRNSTNISAKKKIDTIERQEKTLSSTLRRIESEMSSQFDNLILDARKAIEDSVPNTDDEYEILSMDYDRLVNEVEKDGD